MQLFIHNFINLISCEMYVSINKKLRTIIIYEAHFRKVNPTRKTDKMKSDSH
jgi:hypothetical protein